jgi:hypothetical protein
MLGMLDGKNSLLRTALDVIEKFRGDLPQIPSQTISTFLSSP